MVLPGWRLILLIADAVPGDAGQQRLAPAVVEGIGPAGDQDGASAGGSSGVRCRLRGSGRPSGLGLVVVGHIGTSMRCTPAPSARRLRRLGLRCGRQRRTLIGDRAGAAATVGTDFDLAPLRAGGSTWTASPNYPARPPSSGSASSTTTPLVQRRSSASRPPPDRDLPRALPRRGLHPPRTAPPDQQLAWLEYLHERGCRRISRLTCSSTTWPPIRPPRARCATA